jgi:hypothetical protein
VEETEILLTQVRAEWGKRNVRSYLLVWVVWAETTCKEIGWMEGKPSISHTAKSEIIRGPPQTRNVKFMPNLPDHLDLSPGDLQYTPSYLENGF